MDAREVAVRALSSYRRKGTLPSVDMDSSAGNPKALAADRALAKQILNGVIQNMAYCDGIISHFSDIDLKKLQPQVLDILRISVYQIIFLSRIPHNAAVDEGVKLAKKLSNPRAAGYANAVLRKIANCTANNDLPEVLCEDEHQRLSVKYSHPQWLVRKFCERLGIEGAVKLLECNNSMDRPITAQVNTLLADMDMALTSLKDEGIEAIKHPFLDNCIDLYRPGRVARLDAFAKGMIYIQDAASKLAVLAAGASAGDFVIDACAAPGGKSFASAITMGNMGHVLACDISETKLGLVKDGIERLKIDIIETAAIDARFNTAALLGKADVVLADVPCFGTGVIRKKPDIRYKDPEALSELNRIQSNILSNVSSYVKPGGILLYSTCSLLIEENESIIEAFLDKHADFAPVGFDLQGIGHIGDGMLTLWPHIHMTDGFFIFKLKRC